MADDEEWVIWNGTLGVLDMVRIARIEAGPEGRRAWLAAPYASIGPFSLDELETQGRIAFDACRVMSRARWQLDQVELRRAARTQRQALAAPARPADDRPHREALDLPMDGALAPAAIKAAFRRLARTAHPDAGGSSAHYRRITEARDALMEPFAGAS